MDSQNLMVQPGAFVNASHAVNVVLDKMGLQNSGTFDLTGSTLYLKGSDNSMLQSSGLLSLKKLVVAKNSATVFLKTDMLIADSLIMKGGLLDLNGKNITLQPNAVVWGETESSRITGPQWGRYFHYDNAHRLGLAKSRKLRFFYWL